MTERTRILAPKAMEVWVGVAFGSRYPTVIVVEEERRGKIKELASYVQDVGAMFSGRSKPVEPAYERVTYPTSTATDPAVKAAQDRALERSMEWTQ